MKIYKYLLSLILIVNSFTLAQYSVNSKYLLSPELNIGFVDSCAQFWQNSYDENIGGFFTNVDRQGNVVSAWGTNKNMLTQSRNAYGYVRAYMMTGNNDYLDLAKGALEFMYSSSWDETFGGWFGKVDINGNPSSPGDNKTAFDQHYALLGILAYYEATGDSNALSWFRKGFENNEMKLWDADENVFGYYDYGNYNWFSNNGKSFNATVDVATTHLITAYLLTGEDIYKEKLISVADNIVNRLTSTMDNYEIGFVEKFNTDWTWNDNTDNNNTRTIMGHVLKAGWVLGRIHQVLPNPIYVEAAEKMVQQVWEKGYDHNYGGPYKDYDRLDGQMYFYGQDTAKAWWQMEQAIVAGLELYDITKNDIYLEMADESLDFFMRYFVDHTYGEIYTDLFKNGSLIPAWGTTKGNDWKAGYHSIETGYYAYLYGNLFYNDEPVTLYYHFEPVNYDREVILTPLAINKQLNIREVYLNENLFTDFLIDIRSLNISAGVGGEFKVTFETDIPISVNASTNFSNNFSLSQNYPNPFNPTTVINYTIPNIVNGSYSNVYLSIYDILGREVKVLVNKAQSVGNYKINFNAEDLKSGVYFYTLRTNNFSQTRKMLLVK